MNFFKLRTSYVVAFETLAKCLTSLLKKCDLFCRFYQTRWVEDQVVTDRALEVWSLIDSLIKYWEGLCSVYVGL